MSPSRLFPLQSNDEVLTVQMYVYLLIDQLSFDNGDIDNESSTQVPSVLNHQLLLV